MLTLLLNGDQAILDIRQIEDYCLDPAHPRGRHKPRVFLDALDIRRSDSEWLGKVLLAEGRVLRRSFARYGR